MDIIHLLPDSVANQIAAGEVIQRPASCLKELVENSLDAGATDIQVVVEGAGRTLLQVVDNGSGMSETDARMAFERHATSKIRCADDLFSLHTMGFRGEALASICAVAHIEVITRREEDEVGTLLEIAGTKVVRQEPIAVAKGTNFKVKDLFFNVPARRRFLKTDATELRNLLTEFFRIVLVNPQTNFSFVSEGEVLYQLPAGSLKQRIEGVFGKSQKKNFTGQLVDIAVETPMVNIYGFVGKPEESGKNPMQYMFVNKRYMKHPSFHKAVLTGYQGLLTADRQPSYFVYFEVDPQNIDVNVHPTKTEIKFTDEQGIWQILLATVREALGKYDITPSIDFTTEQPIDIPTAPSGGATVTSPHLHLSGNYDPFKSQSSYQPKVPSSWQDMFPEPPTRVDDDEPQGDMPTIFTSEEEKKVVGQMWGKYVMVQQGQQLLFLDQHRAHECILYASYLKQLENTQGAKQPLLFPEVIELNAEEGALVDEIADELQCVGFDLNRLSKNEYEILSTPAQLTAGNPTEVIRHILQNVAGCERVADSIRREMAATLASDLAIPAGKHLNEDEQTALVRDFFALPDQLTPRGKRAVTVICDEEIGKRMN